MAIMKFGGAAFSVAPQVGTVFVEVKKHFFVGREAGSVAEARELGNALLLAAKTAEDALARRVAEVRAS